MNDDDPYDSPIVERFCPSDLHGLDADGELIGVLVIASPGPRWICPECHTEHAGDQPPITI